MKSKTFYLEQIKYTAFTEICFRRKDNIFYMQRPAFERMFKNVNLDLNKTYKCHLVVEEV